MQNGLNTRFLSICKTLGEGDKNMKERILRAVIKYGIIAILSVGSISIALAGKLPMQNAQGSNYRQSLVTSPDVYAGKSPNHNQTLVRD